mgnify:FL=1
MLPSLLHSPIRTQNHFLREGQGVRCAGARDVSYAGAKTGVIAKKIIFLKHTQQEDDLNKNDTATLTQQIDLLVYCDDGCRENRLQVRAPSRERT